MKEKRCSGWWKKDLSLARVCYSSQVFLHFHMKKCVTRNIIIYSVWRHCLLEKMGFVTDRAIECVPKSVCVGCEGGGM